MTNLDQEYYLFLDSLAKKLHTTKKKILENALGMYQKFLETQALEQQYKSMAKDTKYLEEMQENTHYLGTL